LSFRMYLSCDVFLNCANSHWSPSCWSYGNLISLFPKQS
jgi:hypothetical protein